MVPQRTEIAASTVKSSTSSTSESTFPPSSPTSMDMTEDSDLNDSIRTILSTILLPKMQHGNNDKEENFSYRTIHQREEEGRYIPTRRPQQQVQQQHQQQHRENTITESKCCQSKVFTSTSIPVSLDGCTTRRTARDGTTAPPLVHHNSSSVSTNERRDTHSVPMSVSFLSHHHRNRRKGVRRTTTFSSSFPFSLFGKTNTVLFVFVATVAAHVLVVVAASSPSSTSNVDLGLSSEKNNNNSNNNDHQHHHINPMVDGGCLYQRMPGWTKKRVCSSADEGTAHARLGYCRPTASYDASLDGSADSYDDDIVLTQGRTSTVPTTSITEVEAMFDYREIRIGSQNWESSIFETWIIQVVLSEVLDVPTSVETGLPNVVADFYDRNGRLEFGIIDDADALKRGVEVGDCRPTIRDNTKNFINNDTTVPYRGCSHFIPELWDAEHFKVDKYVQERIIEPAQSMGMIGEENWFVPKFTAERDPTLLSYIGLQGEDNRRKLAERFGRPVRWGEYCRDVLGSSNEGNDGDGTNSSQSPYGTCTDDVSARAPEDDDEAASFFVDGLYTGHFRFDLDANNCTKFPHNCTGHIVDYPCGWTSYVIPQLHHLDIALSSSGNEPGSHGYKYVEMVEILLASNFTKSDIVIFWWSPEALYQQFLGTDMELTQVVLPPVTKECLDHRVTAEERCSSDLKTRVGDPLGVCDEAPHILFKVIGSGVYEDTFSPKIPPALYSPAYDVLKAFQISGAEVGQLFDYARKKLGSGGTNNSSPSASSFTTEDHRVAICDWMVDNFETLKEFIPRDYPRVLRDAPNSLSDPLSISAIFFSSLSIVVVLVASAITYRRRNCLIMKRAQVEFLWLLLAGLFLVSFGALLMAVPPSDGSCVAAIWTISVGYSLDLVPLIVKMAAYYKLMRAARKLRHVQVTVRMLYGAVMLLTFVVIVFLTAWSILDPPHLGTEYELTDESTPDGEVIVTMSFYCTSDSKAWMYAAVGWHLFLLTTATVQAIQTRSIRQEINESQTLAILIYSHFVFAILRLITLFLQDTLNGTDLMDVTSLIFALDAIATIGIYFVPKFLSDDDQSIRGNDLVMESSAVRQLQMLAAVATAQHERQMMMDEARRSTELLLRDTVVPVTAGHALSVSNDSSTNREFPKTIGNFRASTTIPPPSDTAKTSSTTGSSVNTAEADVESAGWCRSCSGDHRYCCPKCGETVELLPSSSHHAAKEEEGGGDNDEGRRNSLFS